MPLVSRRSAILTALAAPMAACGEAGPPPGLAALQLSLDREAAGLATDPRATIGRVQALLTQAADSGAFDAWRGGAPAAAEKVSLIGGGSSGRKWKAQLFLIPAGFSHPPHCHENLASCLVVVDGRLRVREYQRLREYDARDSVMLARAFDGELAPRQAIATTEDYRNAHWFGAMDAPVLAVNFKAVGHVRPELLRLRNRRYIDPSEAKTPTFRAPVIDSASAHERFGRRPV